MKYDILPPPTTQTRDNNYCYYHYDTVQQCLVPDLEDYIEINAAIVMSKSNMGLQSEPHPPQGSEVLF